MRLEDTATFPKYSYEDWLKSVISESTLTDPQEKLKLRSLEEVEYPALVLNNERNITLQTFPVHCRLLDLRRPLEAEVFCAIEEWQKSNGHFAPLVSSSQKSTLIQISLDLIHNAGASAVDEITAGLSMALQFAGKKIKFVVAVGGRHYLGAAKLRALRFLWERFCAENNLPMDFEIHAVSSLREFTLYDQWNNQLRNTCATAAAFWGGADAIGVYPHDALVPLFSGEEWNPQSERLANNVYHILEQESHLGRVADPTGGAHAIENLTTQLVESAYARLLKHEKDNYHTYWQDLPAQVERLSQQRSLRLQNLQDIITGINSYSDPHERFLKGNQEKVYYAKTEGKFPLRRLAHEFEELRISFEKVGRDLRGVILCQGDRKALSARINFSKNYFETAGISMEEHFEFEEDLVPFLTNASVVVLCALDEDYPQLLGISEFLKKYTSNIYVAGKLPAEQLEGHGVTAIYRGQNVYAVLTGLLKEMIK